VSRHPKKPPGKRPQHRPGTVAVVAGDTGRFTNFSKSLAALRKPGGSETKFVIGSDAIVGRNHQVAEMTGEWLWFIDDDHDFPPDTLMNLLAHNVEVVVPICLMRAAPFNPVDFVGEDENGYLIPLDLTSAGRSGLAELYAAGASGMLVRRSVFEAFRQRWPDANYFEHGERSEDIIFCERLRELGIKIYVDLGSRIGHLNVVTVYPDHAADGGWAIGMRVGQNFPIQIGIERRD
jgi:hypothetical protein